MKIEISFSRRAEKGKNGLTEDEKAVLDLLIEDLRATGGKPYGRGWNSLSPVPQYSKDAFHCHLTHNKVVVWKNIECGQGKNKNIECRICEVCPRGKIDYYKK